MRRRQLLRGGAAVLAVPSIARAQNAKVLKFRPVADLAVLDPVWTGARPTRNHGLSRF
jgi:peptide/nickel transport system substrate-binding protein